MPCRASRVRHRPLAAQLVQAPALAMSLVAEGGRKSSRIKVRSPRAVLVDDAVISELRPVELIQLQQPAIVTYSSTTANRL